MADDVTRPPVVTDEVVERVAKAMADDLSKRHYGIDRGPEDAWEAQTDYGRDEWRHAARAALASMPAVVSGGQSELLEWLANNTRLSLEHYSPVYCDDGDQRVEWRVIRQSGSINDREYHCVGRGGTPLAALQSAAIAQPEVGE